MPEAFAEAAVRHWSDAEFCSADHRHPNADQLYGFAAECALKAALLQLPGCLDSGALQRRYREHVNDLWEIIPVQSVHKTSATLVALLRLPVKPFADWSVDQRYEPDVAITVDAMRAHRDAARRVLGAVGLLGVLRGK